MKETSNQIYRELISRLYEPMVFYVPRRVWNQFDKEKWDDKLFDNVFDKVVLVKPDGSNALLNKEPSIPHLLIKKETLDKNTFKLLDIQKDLETKQFKFILNKYCIQLDFCRRISGWLVENIHKDIEDLSEETFMSFELQQTSLKEHWQYVQENFVDIPKSEETAGETLLSKKDFKSFQDLMNPSGILSSKIKLNPFNKETKITTEKPKKEKKILVTEEEATTFLLRTVFNLKL